MSEDDKKILMPKLRQILPDVIADEIVGAQPMTFFDDLRDTLYRMEEDKNNWKIHPEYDKENFYPIEMPMYAEVTLHYTGIRDQYGGKETGRGWLVFPTDEARTMFLLAVTKT